MVGFEDTFCQQFTGGYCPKVKMHVPRNWCLACCGGTGKKTPQLSRAIVKVAPTPDFGCCGGSTILGKIGDIVTGYTNLALGRKLEFTDDNEAACEQCKEKTYLTKKEYAQYLKEQGIKILTNFTQLDKLPKLQKHKQDEKRTKLFCRVCKCFIRAKSRSPGGCSLGKWQTDGAG